VLDQILSIAINPQLSEAGESGISAHKKIPAYIVAAEKAPSKMGRVLNLPWGGITRSSIPAPTRNTEAN
jgi:hypothetical protein